MPASVRWPMSPFPTTAIAGEAIFSGCICTIGIARDVIASHLPHGVALRSSNSETHPCLLAFGEQSQGTTFFGGFSLPWGIRYHELMVAVPFVSWQGAAVEYLFVSTMACDFWPAVWNGNFYYGFKKRFARMGWSGDHFAVADDSESTGFDAVLHSGSGEAPDATLERICAAAALPVLGHRQDGVFVTSCFDWDFRGAAVDAATLELVRGKYLPELPFTAAARHHDACRIQGMRWRLGWPTPANARRQPYNSPDTGRA
jgi:hypothetical protein